MPQADGTIVIDTEIDADGMKAGSKEVEDAVRRMAASVNDLGTKAKTALNKQVDSFVKLNQEYAAQAKKVEELKRKVAEYGNQKVPTDEYREIQTQIDQAKAKMDRLVSAQEKFIAIGGSRKSNTYKRYQYDIDELANTIKYAEGELEDLENTGKAFTFGSKTKEAAADMERLAAAERKLSDMNNRLGTSYSSIKSQVNDYQKSLLKTSTAQQKASNTGKSLSKSLRSTGKSANSANFGIGKMLGTSILFSFVFQSINAAMTALADGFTNLAQYSGTTNRSISMLWSSLERLKNSLATAFAPILDVVAPILSKFIDMLSTAASYVSMFFAFLSGQSTYTRAVAVQKDYAASLEDTAGSAQDAADATDTAAEAAERYLSPLDDINKYSDQGSGSGGGSGSPGGGGGSEGAGSGPLFEEVEITDIPILEKLKDILSKIFKPFKEAWEQEGQATIDAAKYAFSRLGELAKSVGNSLLEVWTNGTGTKILSTLLEIAQGILVTIGNIISQLDKAWNKNKVGTKIVQAIADCFQKILDFINKIVWATADWAKNLDFYPLLEAIKNLFESMSPIIEGIGNFLYDIYTSIILPVAKALIEDILPTIINWISKLFDFIGKNQWIIEVIGAALLGAFAASKIVPLITKIIGAISKVVGVVKTVIAILTGGGGLGAAISAIVSALGGPLTIAIAAAIAIGTLLITHWDEVCTAAQKLAQWISEKFEWIKEKVTEIWNSIVEYLKEKWNSLVSSAKLLFDAIGSTINNVFNGIAKFTTSIWNSITNNISNIWNRIKSAASSIFNGIKTTINNIWSGISNFASSVWNGIRSNLSNIWNGIKNAASSIFNGIRTVISNIWSNIKSFASSVWNGIRSNLSSIWNGIKSSASSIFNGIKTTINNAWSNIKSFASSAWNGIKRTVENIWNGLKNSASNAFNGIRSIVSSVWNSIRQITSSIWNGIVGTIKFAVNGIIGGINGMIRGVVSGINSVIRALNRLSFKIPDWVPLFGGRRFGFNIGTISAPQIPYLASGAVIPPNQEFLAVLGDQNQGNNIEAPESLIRRIVREESGNKGLQRIEVPVYLNGREIVRATVDEAKLMRIQTGRNPFELA